MWENVSLDKTTLRKAIQSTITVLKGEAGEMHWVKM
jgi:hypothetical protein